MPSQALQNHIKFLLKGSAFPASILGLQGDLEDRLKTMPAVQAEDEYRRLLAEFARPGQSRGTHAFEARTGAIFW